MPDFKNSSMNIAATGQGGLGLPDVPYYSADDQQDIRDAYVAHIAKVLELSGVPAADAAEQATAVMAFATRLAHVPKSSEVFSPNVALYLQPVSSAQLAALVTHLPSTTLSTSPRA